MIPRLTLWETMRALWPDGLGRRISAGLVGGVIAATLIYLGAWAFDYTLVHERSHKLLETVDTPDAGRPFKVYP